MKTTLIIFLSGLLLISCGSTKKISSSTNYELLKSKSEAKVKIDKITAFALSFEGTRYKFGGTSHSGMDCSGLVYTAFKSEDISMPRVSREMALQGVKIDLSDAQKGDLLFFKTNRRGNSINHVGIVITPKKGLQFIHSTTSNGVILSSMEEPYWNASFVEIRRII